MEVAQALTKEVQIKIILKELKQFRTAARPIAELLSLAKHVCLGGGGGRSNKN